MVKAGIIGATGYAGVELVRLLLSHPKISQITVSSVSFKGQNIIEIYPHLQGFFGTGTEHKGSGLLVDAEAAVAESDIIFTALPHGLAEKYADKCVKEGKKLVDLSADFRFDQNEKVFKEWYKKGWDYPHVHAESVYGLPEMNRTKIQKARIIGNPGCYVTAATLALLPAVEKNLILQNPIIIDSKSGTTGTGRKPTATNNASECSESCSAYSIGAHRHQPEIANNLANASGGKNYSVVFTPHLLPMSRGIISDTYATLCPEITKKLSVSSTRELAQAFHTLYKQRFSNEPFVRILPIGASPKTKNVRGTNFCDISVHIVNDGKILQVISTLDNTVKGASGQAVQNMNIMYNFTETDGLELVPAAF
ncbi:MAG TPA: N-acetyl-gamma-glutamyl-phosphate reductase [Treponemataceae bacterium]|nr:N-acetyl-gamma-glutamyl-phosphate reductase [Treponemataceae bacterium]